MSRFIQYASNLLDGVDSIAKGSLTDQDIAAAAAERRRRRRQAKLRERQSQGFGPGDLSEGLSESDYGESTQSATSSGRRILEAAPLRYSDGHGHGIEAPTGEGCTVSSTNVVPPSSADMEIPDALQQQQQEQLPHTVHPASSIIASAEDDRGGDYGSSVGPISAPTGATRSQAGNSAPEKTPNEQSVHETSGGSTMGAIEVMGYPSESTIRSGKDETDYGEIAGHEGSNRVHHLPSSPARAPSSPSDEFRKQGFGETTTMPHSTPTILSPTRRPFPSVSVSGDPTPTASKTAVGGASPTKNPTTGISPSRTPLQPTYESGSGVSTGGVGGSPGSAMAVALASGGAGQARSSWGGIGSAGREQSGLGSLLGRGLKTGRGGGGNTEELRAEAAALRVEVEELSLELEDAEERLKGQEMELKNAAEALKRQKATALERENLMSTEMENFQGLQAEEKKVFLANLESMEQSIKDKEREAEEARLALSSLEAFAMEREDVATRLMREKEGLLEDLRGARSVQDRSAEELKEALTRAEAEGEEAAARHRTWMRQAQARQTELEATAAQLAEALADANRRLSGGGEGGSKRSVLTGLETRKALASARELRVSQEELESCQASLELEQERTRALEQEIKGLRHDLEAARATEAVVERQRQEHANMAANSFAKASRLEKQLEQEKANAQRLGAPLLPAGPESQIQALSSKLMNKQARLDESVSERATLTVKLREVTDRAIRAEQELRELRGESLEAGGGEVGGDVGRLRRRADRFGSGRISRVGAWSRLPHIAKHKKIASAVDVLDRGTLQAVVILRTSPMARAVFLGYLVLLHFWAFVVLGLHSHSSSMMQPPTLPGNATN